MSDRKYVVSIDLPGHGEFKALLADVRWAERTYSKPAIAKCIAEGYGGREAGGSFTSYWLKMEKWILAIAYCGMNNPLN